MDKLVPEALLNENDEVDVPFANERLVEKSTVAEDDPTVSVLRVPDAARISVPVAEKKLNEDILATFEPKLVAYTLVPVTFVPVALTNVVFCSEVVPVELKLDVVNPPKSVTEDVATAPLFVTLSRVSTSDPDVQFVPSERHTIVLLMRVSLGKRA